MKKLIFLVVLFVIYGIGADATVVICDSPDEINCYKIERVKKQNGPWKNACSEDLDFRGGQHWEGIREEALNNTSEETFGRKTTLNLISNEIFKGYNWKNNATNTEHTLEFIGKELFYDGKKILTINDNFSAVIMEIPNSNGLHVKIGTGTAIRSAVKSDANKIFDAIWRANEVELRAVKEIKAYPNPLNRTGPLYLSSPTLIDKMFIYDFNGKVVYQNEDDWKGLCELDVNDFQNGTYLVKLVTSKSAITITRKILIISNPDNPKQ